MRTFGPRIPTNGLVLYREGDEGDDLPILVLYEHEPAQPAVLWGDYPEPGYEETATLCPPAGIALTDAESASLIAEAITQEHDLVLSRMDERDDARWAA